ncbi:MAG: shikimate dehydrogenase [Endomicrobium sp.]|jgi:shikimate dehydrogenase|nr:shikimate dehydrogenase [Endomicrobium sp.]
MVNAETKLFAILGDPIKHSFSPQIQNKWFKKENFNGVYLAFEPAPKDFDKTIKSLKILNFCGFNITVPYKVKVMKYVDVMDKVAREIGSVNTISIKNNKFYGYNTDYLGFVQDLASKKINLKSKNVLLIGAGGASRAIAYALKVGQVKNAYVVNRTFPKAQELARVFKLKSIDMNKMGNFVCDCDIDLIINGSSCGMKKTDALPFEVGKVKKGLIIYDLIYNKTTPFVKFAKNNGLKFFTGDGMLIYQGAFGFKIWTGKYPDIGVAKKLLKKLFKRKE